MKNVFHFERYREPVKITPTLRLQKRYVISSSANWNKTCVGLLLSHSKKILPNYRLRIFANHRLTIANIAMANRYLQNIIRVPVCFTAQFNDVLQIYIHLLTIKYLCDLHIFHASKIVFYTFL